MRTERSVGSGGIRDPNVLWQVLRCRAAAVGGAGGPAGPGQAWGLGWGGAGCCSSQSRAVAVGKGTELGRWVPTSTGPGARGVGEGGGVCVQEASAPGSSDGLASEAAVCPWRRSHRSRDLVHVEGRPPLPRL